MIVCHNYSMKYTMYLELKHILIHAQKLVRPMSLALVLNEFRL